MADKKTTDTYSLFHDLRRLGVETLCLLMLLYGVPLQALERVTEPQRADAAEESSTQDDLSWTAPILETAGHTLDAVQDEVSQLTLSSRRLDDSEKEDFRH